ncbi:hypothetical protein BJF86_03390 [Serinicoccus sp. CNJ-927]|nr:hypothetical protein BJF86_03390 [Serinicoccus sp. CNJ-927]
MVVVVPEVELVAGDGVGRLDAAHQARPAQDGQHVVDPLDGDPLGAPARERDHLGGVRVRVLLQQAEDRQPGAGHPQPGTTQGWGEVGRAHALIRPPQLEPLKLGETDRSPPPVIGARIPKAGQNLGMELVKGLVMHLTPS